MSVERNPGEQPRERADRFRLILETSAKLICKNGYDGTSIQEIADACGLTKAGLYHHIQSKENLLAEIMEYGMDVFEEEVLAHVRSIDDPIERLKATMHRNVMLVTRSSSKEVTIILHEHATLQGPPGKRINERKKNYVRFLEESFEEAVKAGRVRPVDPSVAAFSFLGMILWTYKWFRPDGRLSEEQIASGMIDLLFGSIEAPKKKRSGS